MDDVDRTAKFVALKRAADIAGVVLSGPFTCVVGAMATLLVRRRLGSPVLYRQTRIGKNGTPFEVLKFRSMTNGVDEDGTPLPDRDRLTPFGRLLRKTSVDELPQLLNVLMGDMSLVGPRPLLPGYLPWYTERESRRHLVRPGLTGLAQVSGRNGLTWDDRLELDVLYVDRASMRLDAVIIAKTLKKLFATSGVSVIAGETGAPLHVERSFPRSDRVRLRRLSKSDLGTRVDWMGHPAITRFTEIPEGITLASTEAWFQKSVHDPSRLDFVAVDHNGNSVAMAGVKEENTSGAGEFYIFVNPQRLGEGIGGEVTRLVMEWAAQSGLYMDLVLDVHSQNAAAVKIYERLGWRGTGPSGRRVTMTWRVEQ